MGMRQRLGIAAALLGDPEVLILDEPTNGLDPPGIRWVRELVQAQSRRGRAVLVSSHLLAEVAQSVDDVIVIAEGRLRATGPLDVVLGADRERVTLVRTPDAARLRQLLEASTLGVDADGGDALLVHGASSELVGAIAAEHRVPLVELRPHARSLEDAFLALTGSYDL
jgi:ABC-2 type transport system ATP-binding protein